MEKKKNYIAPAVLDELLLEMEGQILHSSTDVIDNDFQEVETMGQETPGNSFEYTFDHQW